MIVSGWFIQLNLTPTPDTYIYIYIYTYVLYFGYSGPVGSFQLNLTPTHDTYIYIYIYIYIYTYVLHFGYSGPGGHACPFLNLKPFSGIDINISCRYVAVNIVRCSSVVLCFNMAGAISPALVQIVTAILAKNAETVGALTLWKEILEVLLTHKVAYTMRLHPDLLFTHMCNRGGLGLNAFNVHRNMSKIHRIGADLQKLVDSTCFEMPKDVIMRKKQTDFNLSLIKNAAGLLAPCTGRERYLSVGGGHTTAGCRAINHGCATPEARLADGKGKLNASLLWEHRPILKQMCTEGWEWTIIPHEVQETWPGIPALAQQALNASNSVSSETTELESASTIAQYAEQSDPATTTWDMCIAAAAASNPPCVDYIDAIGKYAKLFGGGKGACMVTYLDTFQKKSARIGSWAEICSRRSSR
jgi:hypothetical protein